MDDKNFPYTSLCKVTAIENNGVRVLERLTDFWYDKFNSLQILSITPQYKFFKNINCDLPVNFIGVFGWKIESKRFKKFIEKEFISKYYSDKNPIEILILENCTNKGDLRRKLWSGIKFNFSTKKILIAYQVTENIYRGVLCTENDFEQIGDMKKITTIHLKLFDVPKTDCIQVEEKIFYSKFDFNRRKSINFHTQKSLAEVITEKIIARANWMMFKERVSERDLRIFEEFIKNFSTEDFYSEIAEEYLISAEEAKKYVNMFVKNYEEYIQTEIFQDEVFENIIYHCPNLIEEFEKWRVDNQEKINTDNLRLQEIQQKIDEELETCIELEKEIEANRKILDDINNQIKQRQDFAVEVENEIARRIESAKKNAADFICEMAFVNPISSAVQTSKNNFYRGGKVINGADSEIEDIQDFILCLETEIGIAGAGFENMLSFAAYLTAAYMKKILLLLAGPNARDIADAFSVTLTGKTSAIFDCSNVTSLEDMEVVLNSDDEIISVLNPFSPNFIAYLPELVNIGGKFIFAIYPFAEDLKMEPRSFYNYFLPVFTELIIDRPPARKFPIKYFLSDKLRQYLNSKYNPDEIPISAEKRVKQLEESAQEISNSQKSSILFADFPLAYVKGKEEKFISEFKDDEKILERIRTFLGTDNE